MACEHKTEHLYGIRIFTIKSQHHVPISDSSLGARWVAISKTQNHTPNMYCISDCSPTIDPKFWAKDNTNAIKIILQNN